MSNLKIDKINGIPVSELSGDGSWSPKIVNLRYENVITMFESTDTFAVGTFSVDGAFFPIFPNVISAVTKEVDLFFDYDDYFNITITLNTEPSLARYKSFTINEVVYNPTIGVPFQVHLLKGINKIKVVLEMTEENPDIKSTYPIQLYTITDVGVSKHINLFDSDNRLNESLMPKSEFKAKKLTGIMPNAQGKDVSISHNLHVDKIISVNCLVEDALGGRYTQNYRIQDGYEYGIVVDSLYVKVRTTTTNSAKLIDRPFTMYVVYEY